MFERPSRGNRALLVALDLGGEDAAWRRDEIAELATSAGALASGIESIPGTQSCAGAGTSLHGPGGTLAASKPGDVHTGPNRVEDRPVEEIET